MHKVFVRVILIKIIRWYSCKDIMMIKNPFAMMISIPM